MNQPLSPIILALDVPTQDLALHWVKTLRGRVTIFKVGMQLFYRYGPDIVRRVQDAGGQVFLDLKLHDIPNTVARACESILDLNVTFLTLHISGGYSMLEEAQQVVENSSTRLLGITALTSLDSESLQAVYPDLQQSPSEWALHLVGLARQAGLYGVVCSAAENRSIRQQYGSQLRLINPGIRPSGTDIHDQKRVLSPREAMAAGANFLVMGRPILQAPNPEALVESILQEVHDEVGLSS